MPQHAFVFPSSFSQQRLWFLDRLAPSHAFYNMPAAVRISTAVDCAALQYAIDALARRHESLRTSFVDVDGYSLQVVAPSVAIPVDIMDLTCLNPSDRVPEAERQVRVESARAFDLSRAPLLRVSLLRLAERDHILLVTAHHIIADGWSFDILFRELASFYDAGVFGRRVRLPKLRVQYADFALWQHRWLTGPFREEQRRYWRRQLAGLPDILALPTDRPRPAEKRFLGGLVPVTLAEDVTKAVRRLAQTADATLFMVGSIRIRSVRLPMVEFVAY
jgi:hypothetical protein